MKRREFIKKISTVIIGAGVTPAAVAEAARIPPLRIRRGAGAAIDDHIKDYLSKLHHFDEPHPDDVCLDSESCRILEASLRRLKRIERTVGHGNFYLLDFDTALKIARNYPSVGEFPKRETDFLERIFYQDAVAYGFFGEKPMKRLTDQIPTRDVLKIQHTGNYLYAGPPAETYKRIRKDIGEQAILTSGVRSVIKQFLLYLNKAYKSGGNLSLASRSLAPPGFSYHGVGDFDVGQVGLGSDNFTARFVTTEVFERLKQLDYVDLRYARDNLLGVRFEPWHVKLGWRA